MLIFLILLLKITEFSNFKIEERQGWIVTIFSENFELGIIPSGWTIIDGNNDGIKWTCGTTPDLTGHEPPYYGTAYAYYSDDDAGNGVINYNEELWTPKIKILHNFVTLKLKYGYGFKIFENGEKYRVHFRKKVGNLWTEWNELRVYTTTSSGRDSFDLTNHLPCDSIQFRFFYSDSTAPHHFGWACAVDNLILNGLYIPDHDVGISEITSPSGIVLIHRPVSVIVKCKNFGLNTENFRLIVRIYDPSNSIVFSKDTNLTIYVDSTITSYLGEWIPSTEGFHFIYGKVLLPGDENFVNDSAGHEFKSSYWSSWTEYSKPQINADRVAHATVYDYDNDKIYMIGGTPNGQSGSFLPYIYRYDPQTDTWEENLSNMPSARGWIQAGYFSGKIYVPGGFTNEGGITNTFYIYDIATDTWTQGPSLPARRCAYGLVMWNGNLYVIGGQFSADSGAKTVFRYNISSNTWTNATPLSRAFDMGGACILGDTIYLVGGYDRNYNYVWHRVLRGIINPLNPDSIVWTWLSFMPSQVALNGVTTLNGKIYVIGGFRYISGQWQFTDKVYEYDPASNTWKELLNNYVVPIARHNFAVARPQINGTGARIYVVAGDANGNWSPPNDFYYYTETLVPVNEEYYPPLNFDLILSKNLINKSIEIILNLNEKKKIEISLLNSSGRKIAEIFEGEKKEGRHKILWRCEKLTPGIYFVKFKINSHLFFKKILKIR